MQVELFGIIGKLDYTWYSDIKRLYDKLYDPKIKKAKIIVPSYCRGYDPDTGKDCEDEIIYCGIKEFCWEYDFERIRTVGDESPVEGQWIITKIERIIAEHINDMPSANLDTYIYSDKDLQKHYIVENAYSIVRTKISEIKANSQDLDYLSVLTYFLLRLRHNLYSHYGYYRQKAHRVKRIEWLLLGTQPHANSQINQIAFQPNNAPKQESSEIQLPGIKDTDLQHISESDNSGKHTLELLPTLSETLKNNFKRYGLFELKMIKPLKADNIEKLIVKISENKLPYKIAMIHFLGVIDFLEVQHFKIKENMYAEIGRWFQSDKRAISGNIRVLSSASEDNKKRYTANNYTELVKEDYNKIKLGLLP